MDISGQFVSVILPVFNGGRWVGQAINSILEQHHSNIELIVTDDGSTDNTLEILRSFQRQDVRVQVISRENRGIVATLNEAILVARGEWIARMDADDIASPRRLGTQLRFAIDNGLDICGSYIRTFGSGLPRRRTYPVTASASRLQLLFNTSFAHPAVIARASVMKSFSYDPKFEKIEDYELWTRISAAGYRLGNVPEDLLFYRKSSSQVTAKSRDYQDNLRAIVAKKYALEVFPSISVELIDLWGLRSACIEPSLVELGAYSLLGLIKDGADIENVLVNNLSIFLYHHSSKIPKSLLNDLWQVLDKEQYFSILALRILKLDYSNKYWKLLYNMK